MKIVLDSNILLVSIGRRSQFRPIWTAFISGKFTLIVSDDIIYEYEEILQRRASPGIAKVVMDTLIESPKVIYQQIYYSWNAIRRDPDDNKFFDIAIATNADYLVTNDAHFNEAKQLIFPNVKIIDAEEFLSVIEHL
jgi:putative PIN family toxin of toxin-antitoxin system